MIIRKKCWPEYFEEILNDEKKFELRLGNIEAEKGDILILEEWNPATKEYTGRTVKRKITYTLRTKYLDFWPSIDIEEYGFLIMSLEKVE